MAKQIIVLERNQTDGGLVTIRALFWIPVAAAVAVPQPAIAASAWKGATDAEVQALQAGTVVEESRTFTFPVSLTTAQLQAILQLVYTDRVTYIAALPARGQYYGSWFDGTAWGKT